MRRLLVLACGVLAACPPADPDPGTSCDAFAQDYYDRLAPLEADHASCQSAFDCVQVDIALHCQTDLFSVEIHKCPVIISRSQQQAFVAAHDRLATEVCAGVYASCYAAPRCTQQRLACVAGRCGPDPCPAAGCDGGSAEDR